MKLSLSRPAAVARITAAAVLGVTVVVLVPDPARAATVTIQRTSDWGSGYVGKVSVHNDAATTVNGWRVEFDLPAGTGVSSHWSAVLSRSDNHYTFTNQTWNGTIAPGGVVDFGFVAAGSGGPLKCVVNGAPCGGQPPTTPPTTPTTGPTTSTGTTDAQPPTTPTNLRWTTLGTNALWWDASTDDRGVVGYEVYERGTYRATVTNPRYDLPGPPPPTSTIYGITAVDAAGNKSVLATTTLGQVPDLAFPTAPTNLILRLPSQGYLTATWTASADDVMVVGYEVDLNGTLVRTVGGTKALIPAGSYGVFFVSVRAIDSSGRYSPYVRTQLIIEPYPSRTTAVTP